MRWYGEFSADDALRLIQRNVDRECARQDIDHGVFEEYLKDLASKYVPNQPTPTDLMDTVFDARRPHFLLPGLPLVTSGGTLSRFMRLDHLVKYNLHHAGVPITYDLAGAIVAIRSGVLAGKDLQGSHMGRADFPVWVTETDSLPTGASAQKLRDLLGLTHIAHGHLVKVTYPAGVLDTSHLALRAPTVLDAVAGGAENWIFAKRAGAGGPEWGHTVDLGSSSPGAKEAVHRDFKVTAVKAPQIGLRYCGQIAMSPPQVSFQTLLSQI